MPNLVGQSVDEARAELIPYNVRITTENRIDASPAGMVIDQDPPGGAPFSTDVALVVSVKPPDVPNVVGETVATAREVLGELGFQIEEEEVLDEQVVDGLVLGQDPPEGTTNVGLVSIQVARRPVVVFLTDLEAVNSSRVQKGTFDANGVTYDKALNLAGPDGFVEFNLSRAYRRLLLVVGVRDDSDATAVIRFNVFADGRLLKTQDLRLGEPVDLDLDVADALRLRIDTATLAGESYNIDFVLGNPRLYGLEGEVPD
jgi:hypothetical protein